MSNTINTENNPFFYIHVDKMCIVCNNKLFKLPIYSILDEITNYEPRTKVINALEKLSNFKQINIDKAPQKICHSCFCNTAVALKFQKLCDNSVSFLESYLEHQEEIKTKALIEFDECEPLPELTIPPGKVSTNEESENNDNEKHGNENIENEKQRSRTGGIKVKCHICNKYCRQDYLIKHVRIHTGEKPYSCKQCDKRFKNATELNAHKVSHSDAQFLCTICGKSFKWQQSLNSHFRTHTGERPHECEICGKTFRAREILRDHLVVHSNEKPFACEICGKCFPAKRHLRQHMISHEEVKRHECHFCGKRFTQAHSLRTHLSKYCKGSS